MVGNFLPYKWLLYNEKALNPYFSTLVHKIMQGKNDMWSEYHKTEEIGVFCNKILMYQSKVLQTKQFFPHNDEITQVCLSQFVKPPFT